MIRIYKYIPHPENYDQNFPPIEHDYVRGLNKKLYRRTEMYYGQPAEIEYFGEFDGTTYSDLVVKEVWHFERDENLLPIYKECEIFWYQEDGTPHSQTKKIKRFFTEEESIAESRKRRKNLIQKLQYLILSIVSTVVPGGNIELGRAFIASISSLVSNYIDYATNELETYMTTAHTEHAWMLIELAPGFTIQAFILDALNIP